MKLYYDSSDVSFPGGTVVTIGAYDGVHIGHRYLISKTIQISKEIGAESVVVTFDRHPAKVVRPESAPLLLSDLGQKLELLEETGVDAVCMIQFDQDRAMEGPVEFVENFLVGRLNAKYVVVGSDFHFGHNRAGNVDLLRQLGETLNFEVVGAPLKAASEDQIENVSSTLIRRLVSSGDMDRAMQYLGRRFELRGIVVHGDKRGSSELGFPTANVSFSDEMATPPDGIYAGWVVIPDGTRYDSAISLGTRPTYYPQGGDRLLEAFILGFEGDLYQTKLRIVFGKKIRDQERFSTAEELQAKIWEDIEAVSSFCRSNSL